MTRNRGYDYAERLDARADGQRLLDYLAARHAHATVAQWRERIVAGRVLVDDRVVAPDAPLRRGQRLVWRRPPWDEPEAPVVFGVLFEDDALLAVAKPAGLPTLPGGGFLESTLLHRLRGHAPSAAPLHRLGRHTSGVVLCSKSRAARAALVRQWSAGSVEKRYRALARGVPARAEFTIDERIGPRPHPLLGTVHAASPTGRPARSRVVVVERREGAFLCDVWIATGRPHQIRIHLAVAGHPLLGDPLYPVGGVPAAECRALPGDPGYRLHAAEIAFEHPRHGRRMRVACAPPPELRGPARAGFAGSC